MDKGMRTKILAVFEDGRDLVLATIGPDGGPQATAVSYVNDGLTLFFGAAINSQKARNLARDNRISAVITLPYRDWMDIRGVSLSGWARPLSDLNEMGKAGVLFLKKFPEMTQYVSTTQGVALFEVQPEYVSLLDYRQGFGHTDLVRITDLEDAA
jgi:nitroimidazol reductase NimA-like FMN-containing flavoprotein (pyridoxamine 5'-phosphate oxidase superfamily)